MSMVGDVVTQLGLEGLDLGPEDVVALTQGGVDISSVLQVAREAQLSQLPPSAADLANVEEILSRGESAEVCSIAPAPARTTTVPLLRSHT